ncbi:M24 family metallopeptidase [Paenibacillus lutrae]|uniref:M24 family metallopeptidase n=1 Tax=Paenibacillus lutrae TaxID=2078573 RepID=A0A7X3FLU6_9BACL|nr:M24 family metallopeptidase [Paenibacillus lutrae]
MHEREGSAVNGKGSLHTEYMDRQGRLQEVMRTNGIDGFLVNHNVDLFYFNGSMQTGYLFVPAEGTSLFIVRRSITRAREESAAEVEELGSLRTLRDRLAQRYPGIFAPGQEALLATELDVLPVQQFQRLEAAFGGVKWKDGSLLVKELRMIKSPAEIDWIRKAAVVIDRTLEAAISGIREGMSELELMTIIERENRLQGHLGLMRMRAYNSELITGCVAAGASAAEPTYFDGPAGGRGLSSASPQSASTRVIGRNEPILIDIGCCIDGYVIDQTRIAVIGRLPGHLQRAYEVSERILQEAEAMLKPGTIAEHLYLQSLDTAAAEGLADHYMGFAGDQVKFLGHGIGLEIDEFPVLAKGFKYPLQPGMVIAIEPKFTFPGEGVVGIENTYVITETGFEKLTVSREGILAI